MAHHRITLKTLASRLSVSHTTVSLALRDHPSISTATRERVKALADELGYRPDPMMSALVAYRQTLRPQTFQGVLGWLTNYPTADGWCVGQQVGYHEGARKRAHELGYELAEFWLREPGVTKQRLRQIMMTRNVQGLVVAAQAQPRTQIDFDWSGLAAVSLGYSLIKPELHLVMNHQFRNMMALIHQLIQKGYRRIGLAMLAARDDRVDHNYLAGYLMGLYSAPQLRSLPPYLPQTWETAGFLSWHAENEPEVIVTETGSVEMLQAGVKSMNLETPAQVGLALANTPYRQSFYSGIDENPELVGATAVDVAVGMIHRNEFGVPQNARHILIQGTWKEGKTTQKQPPAHASKHGASSCQTG